MPRPVHPLILPRRAVLSGLGGLGIATFLTACGGQKATSSDAFATNAALNTEAARPPAAAAQNGTPAASGSAVTASAGGSVVPPSVGTTTAAGTATTGSATAGAAPPATHITGVGPLPKPLPTQGGAAPTIVVVSPASPASGTPASVPSNTLATAGVATAPGTTAPGTAAPGAGPAAATQVTITPDRAFSPPQVTIRTGQAILWVNGGRAPQTVTGDPNLAANKQDAALPAGAQPWDSGVLNPGGRYTHTFTTPGDYVYFSVPFERQGMVGRITVTG